MSFEDCPALGKKVLGETPGLEQDRFLEDPRQGLLALVGAKDLLAIYYHSVLIAAKSLAFPLDRHRSIVVNYKPISRIRREISLTKEVKMAENVKSRTIRLICPFCEKEGKTEATETSAEDVRVPAVFKRWVPKWAQEKGFLSLEEAAAKDARLEALIVARNGRKEAPYLCSKHGFVLREAKIWVERLSVILERQAQAEERRTAKAFNSIGSILAGKAQEASKSRGDEPDEDEGAGAQARAEQEEIQRKLTAAAAERVEEAAELKPKGKGRKAIAKGSTKGRGQSALRKQIDEALNED